MCSSPKSSGGTVHKVRLKSYYEDLNPQQRKRFTEIANRADERRQQRNQLNKRWKTKHAQKAPSDGLFSWFGKLLGHS